MTEQEMIEVISAYKRGEMIEYRIQGSKQGWQESLSPLWDFSLLEYRVKQKPQKPREIWLVEHASGDLSTFWVESELEAKSFGYNPIKFIEVTDKEEEA